MRPTSITVVAHPDRIVPMPAAALRSPTGAQCKLLGSSHKATHPHELEGAITLELTTPEVAQYIRRRIAAGDLVVAPAVAAAAPSTPAPRAAARKD